MNQKSKYSLADYQGAEDLCAYIMKNMEIHYQLKGAEMEPDQARAHFRNRQALGIVRKLLVDEAERVANDNQGASP